VTVTFRELHIESGANCESDNVTLYSGRDSRGSLIGRYCGNRIPQPLTVSSSAVFVVFTSDMYVNDGRFALSWNFNEGQSSSCPRFQNIWKKTSAKSKSASFIHFVFHVIVIQTF